MAEWRERARAANKEQEVLKIRQAIFPPPPSTTSERRGKNFIVQDDEKVGTGGRAREGEKMKTKCGRRKISINSLDVAFGLAEKALNLSSCRLS
jgi:hypothetical protein